MYKTNTYTYNIKKYDHSHYCIVSDRNRSLLGVSQLLLSMIVGLNITLNFPFFQINVSIVASFFNKLTYCMEQETHTGMKSYTCTYCKKSFSQLSYCKQHKRTHTGEKPYTCKHCKKFFSQLPNCK